MKIPDAFGQEFTSIAVHGIYALRSSSRPGCSPLTSLM